MQVPHVIVDLRKPPRERWAWLEDYRESAASLMDSYARDLGGTAVLDTSLVGDYLSMFVLPEERADLEAVAAILDRPFAEVAIANLYYDAIKILIGCTAFAIDSPDGPLHARNLDWWSEDGRLQSDTLVM